MIEEIKRNLGGYYNNSYNWHPLYKFVIEVKVQYLFTIKTELGIGLITEEDYKNLIYNTNFQFWLAYLSNSKLREEFNYEELLNIFKPLMINQCGNYVLFKYKGYIELSDLGYDLTTFFDLYNGLYLECRSIVFDIVNNSITLASMKKFFNYGENENQWSANNIKDAYINASRIEITNKMDGSYQQFTCLKSDSDLSECLFCGSGSQTLDEKESWRLKKGWDFLLNVKHDYVDLLKDYPNWTFQFEMICPENAIVVHYDKSQEGLYLFNARNNLTGEEMNMDDLRTLSVFYDVPMVEWYRTESLWSILNQTKNYTSDKKEGWVLKIYNTVGQSFRVKIKTDDYVLMHKVLSKMISPNAIIEAVDTNRIDDLMAKIPLGQKDIATEYLKEVYNYLKIMREVIDKYYNNLLENLPEDEKEKRKYFMIGVTEKVPQDLRSYVINKYLGREKSFLARLGSNEKSPGYFTIKEIRERVNKLKILIERF